MPKAARLNRFVPSSCWESPSTTHSQVWPHQCGLCQGVPKPQSCLLSFMVSSAVFSSSLPYILYSPSLRLWRCVVQVHHVWGFQVEDPPQLAICRSGVQEKTSPCSYHVQLYIFKVPSLSISAFFFAFIPLQHPLRFVFPAQPST